MPPTRESLWRYQAAGIIFMPRSKNTAERGRLIFIKLKKEGQLLATSLTVQVQAREQQR
jgi:hypothetical protein